MMNITLSKIILFHNFVSPLINRKYNYELSDSNFKFFSFEAIKDPGTIKIKKTCFSHFLNRAIALNSVYYMGKDINDRNSVSESAIFIDCTFKYIRTNLDGGAVYSSGPHICSFKSCMFSYISATNGACFYITSYGYHHYSDSSCVINCYATSNGHFGVIVQADKYTKYMENYTTIAQSGFSDTSNNGYTLCRYEIDGYTATRMNYSNNAVSEANTETACIYIHSYDNEPFETGISYSHIENFSGGLILYIINEKSSIKISNCNFVSITYSESSTLGLFYFKSSISVSIDNTIFYHLGDNIFLKSDSLIYLSNCHSDSPTQQIDNMFTSECYWGYKNVSTHNIQFLNTYVCTSRYIEPKDSTVLLILIVLASSIGITAVFLFIVFAIFCPSWVCCCCRCKPCLYSLFYGTCLEFLYTYSKCDAEHVNKSERCLGPNSCDNFCCCKENECCSCCCRTWAWYWVSHPFWCKHPKCERYNQIYCDCCYCHTDRCECECYPKCKCTRFVDEGHTLGYEYNDRSNTKVNINIPTSPRIHHPSSESEAVTEIIDDLGDNPYLEL